MFHEIHLGSWLLIPAAVLFVAFYVADWIYARKHKPDAEVAEK
jgi:hypothetical protein